MFSGRRAFHDTYFFLPLGFRLKRKVKQDKTKRELKQNKKTRQTPNAKSAKKKGVMKPLADHGLFILDFLNKNDEHCSALLSPVAQNKNNK